MKFNFIIILFILLGCENTIFSGSGSTISTTPPTPPIRTDLEVSFNELPSLNNPQEICFHYKIYEKYGGYSQWDESLQERIHINFTIYGDNLIGTNEIADAAWIQEVTIGQEITLCPEFMEINNDSISIIKTNWFFYYDEYPPIDPLVTFLQIFKFNSVSGEFSGIDRRE